MAILHSVSDLLDLRTVNATWHLGPCAEVRVGEHVTRYVRRGSGPSVLLLAADAESNPVWGPLVENLSGTHRLVVPQLPSKCVDATEWLRGFIEGIGLTAVLMIAAGMLNDPALELTTTDDFTVRKLVLLSGGAEGTGESSQRVLRVSSERDTHQAVREVVAFLAA